MVARVARVAPVAGARRRKKMVTVTVTVTVVVVVVVAMVVIMVVRCHRMGQPSLMVLPGSISGHVT
jgi:heme/copper-type cytochrome/quinol oxidase subunit 2